MIFFSIHAYGRNSGFLECCVRIIEFCRHLPHARQVCVGTWWSFGDIQRQNTDTFYSPCVNGIMNPVTWMLIILYLYEILQRLAAIGHLTYSKEKSKENLAYGAKLRLIENVCRKPEFITGNLPVSEPFCKIFFNFFSSREGEIICKIFKILHLIICHFILAKWSQ